MKALMVFLSLLSGGCSACAPQQHLHLVLAERHNTLTFTDSAMVEVTSKAENHAYICVDGEILGTEINVTSAHKVESAWDCNGVGIVTYATEEDWMHNLEYMNEWLNHSPFKVVICIFDLRSDDKGVISFKYMALIKTSPITPPMRVES